jgi:hypothetical protein
MASFRDLLMGTHDMQRVTTPEVCGRTLGQWATMEKVDADRCGLCMTADNLDWTALALGSLRAEFEVIQPPELLELLREWSGRFRRAAVG